jgi:hypothetical protein
VLRHIHQHKEKTESAASRKETFLIRIIFAWLTQFRHGRASLQPPRRVSVCTLQVSSKKTDGEHGNCGPASL